MDLVEFEEFTEEVLGLRNCDKCHGVIWEGFTDNNGEVHVCDGCFKKFMDEKYGKNLWRQKSADNREEFYEYFENNCWKETGIFWTEWDLKSTSEQIPLLFHYLTSSCMHFS